jgi:AAA15 family ATPase/GTPase
MIHRIRIQNYRSIREADIDLRIPKNVPDLPRFRISHSRSDTRLPTVITIVGAKGAGKSNVLFALSATLKFVVSSFDNTVSDFIHGFTPFWSERDIGNPTRIEIDFDAAWIKGQPHLFRYTLELNNSETAGVATSVKYEALSYYPSTTTSQRKSPRRIFERNGQELTIVGPELDVKKSDDRLKSVRPNASVISTLAKLNVELPMRIARDLASTVMLSSQITSSQFSSNPEPILRNYIDAPARLQKLNNEISRFDIGIENIEVLRGANGLQAVFHHHGLKHPIPLHEESAGTRHLLTLFPMLEFTLETGRICIIDEFDSFFHPMLIAEIFRWFQDPARNPHKAQLIVTLQNSLVIDDLEKPELLLAEKSDNETSIYSAQDIEGLRREKSLLTKYRAGALGALPRIG